ncbi:MAG TPA: ATP-binding protein, partial [Bacteroidales bacterium]
SEQLLHIIDDIIDISKIEANQLKIVRNNVVISDLLSDLLLFYENEKVHMSKAEIEIKAEISPLLKNTTINTDESRLRQILMNLISNALKFTERGCVTFGFTQHPKQIEFYVSDTGIGIPPNRQSQIFKRFRQLDETFTRRFGGTGLGLAICEGLIKLLGGRIWVKSEVNEGATFYFNIPTDEEGAIAVSPKKEKEMTGEYDWSDKTILIVEDDEINQEFLVAILGPSNANIITASTGEEAVSICGSDKSIDLVLMDIRLPQMNGYEAFSIIKKENPLLPMIAQTAFAMTEDASRCLELGFSDYISKPINRKSLLSMINRLLVENHKKI